jgi:diguanylate cyclase (GGDEF)-like protein
VKRTWIGPSSPSLRERLGWNEAGFGAGGAIDRGMIARILAYLFGLGGILLLITLALPDTERQNTGQLVAVAAVALAAACGLFVGYERLPLRVLRAAPFLGTVLVGLVVYYADPGDSAAYAMYLAWVLVGSALFLDPRLILVHGVLAIAVYSLALLAQDASADGVGVRIAMTTGTVVATTIVMSGIGRHVRGAMDRLASAAHTDPLTGLPNRRALDEAFVRELARSARTRSPLGVVILDIDGFKRFNDARGHLEGDRALQRMGFILRDKTRAVDQVARIGGEEFALLVPDSDTAGGVALAERLRRAVEVEFSDDGELTASCGVASHPANGKTPAALIAAADAALYEAKRMGRNRVVAASDEEPALQVVQEDR